MIIFAPAQAQGLREFFVRHSGKHISPWYTFFKEENLLYKLVSIAWSTYGEPTQNTPHEADHLVQLGAATESSSSQDGV
jgi:hypothetical protein